MLPIFLETARLLIAKFPDTVFVCPTPKVVEGSFKKLVSESNIKIKHISAESVSSDEFNKLKNSLYACTDLALVTSGTVVLELSKASVPMIVGISCWFFN